jgi:hypothetical protein
MNVFKILLILGLGYFALTQKSEKTKNMLLVVTGLLAFCMFSLEGFDSITFTAGADGTDDGSAAQAAAGTGALTIGGQIRSTGNRVYTFPIGFNVGTGAGEVGYTCGSNKVKGPPGPATGPLSAETVEDAFPCVSKQLCSASSLTCSSGTKKSGASDYCVGSTCAAVDFGNAPSACCETDTTDTTDTTGGPCTADKCNTWDWFGMADHGEKCEDGFGWDTYCEE